MEWKINNIVPILAVIILIAAISAKANIYNKKTITDCFSSIVVSGCSGSSSVLSEALTTAQVNAIVAMRPYVAGASLPIYNMNAQELSNSVVLQFWKLQICVLHL